MLIAATAALGSVLAYTGMNILFRRHAPGANALALAAWFGLLLPLWWGLLALGYPHNLFTLPAQPAYYLHTAIWAGCTVGTLVLLIHLLKTVPLTPLTAARKALVTLGTLAADTFLFGIHFTPVKIALCGIILAATLTLPQTVPQPSPKARKSAPKSTQTTLQIPQIALIILLSLLFTLQLSTYKLAMAYQPDLLSHIIFAKGLAAFFSLPLFLLPQVRKNPITIKGLPVAAMVGCFALGSILEAAAIRDLPLTYVLLISMLAPALFAVYDLATKSLPRTPKTAAILAVIFSAFYLLATT